MVDCRDGSGDEGTEEGPGGVLVAEVDVVARGEEVGDDEAGEHVDQTWSRLPGSRYGSTSGARKAVATRMIRGSPSTVSWLSVSPGSRRQHQRQVLVGAQLAGGDDDGAHEQVLERVGTLDLRRAAR